MPAATSPPTTFADWFNRQRRHLAGNGLWLDGGEPGRQPPAEFATARVRILFCRLSTYAGTTPSITHRLLYWAARQCPGVYADLAFLPPATDTAFLQREGVPWWLATGSKQPPAAFDIVAVSLSVPQETINLPAALKHSGLHLGARQRLADPAQPIILLGGNAAPSAPFLHGDAAGDGSGGLVDAVCNGDGITFLQRFLAEFDAWKHPRQRQADANAGGKAAFLARLAGELPGLYVPTLYTHATATGAAGTPALTITPAAESAPFPVAYRTDPPESWLEGYDGGYIPFANEDLEETLPLAIGCHYRCRFCQTGWGRGPETDSPVPALAQAARRLKAATAASDLNLLAADAASVPALHEALAALRPLFRQVSLKSLAVTSLAKEDTARDFLARLDKHEFSLGVEGISHRLRAWLGKQCDPDDLLRVLRTLAPLGLRQVKLFLIATGRETAADVTEFLELLANLRAACPAGRFILSFTPLFHAPFTPLQFAPIHPPDP
ncbi:MAG: radical SAM protein, partial [Lentisphaeria bacterium]